MEFDYSLFDLYKNASALYTIQSFNKRLDINNKNESENLLLKTDFEEWSKNCLKELKSILLIEINKLNEKEIFFYGCNFNNYHDNYYYRKELFIRTYHDSIEIDFIIEEIEKYNDAIELTNKYELNTDNFSLSEISKEQSFLLKIVDAIGIKQFKITSDKILIFLNKNKKIAESRSRLPKIKSYNTQINEKKIADNTINSGIKSEKINYTSSNQNKTEQSLPPFEDVFFIHYQCEDFNVSDEITSLSIFADDKVIEFKSKSEAENIDEYCKTVNHLVERRLIPIHWSQNRPYYGVEHITSRYYKLTGNQIELEYKNSLNLSGILKHKFGEDYVNHSRLDNLALLNSFSGNSEKEKGQRTFDANRVLLLSKIYFGLVNKTLKIGVDNAEEALKPAQETKLVPKQSTNDIESIEKSSINNFMRLTIIEKLEDVLTNVNNIQYDLIVEMLNKYFQNNRVTFSTSKINLGKLNKKKVGWALKEIYTSITNESLSYEYLEFIKENVLLFRDVELKKDDFFYCNLYKYFTTKV